MPSSYCFFSLQQQVDLSKTKAKEEKKKKLFFSTKI